MAVGTPAAPVGSGGPGPNVGRNILVSVTSTVLGATIIYFLGFHKKGEPSFLVTKEATTSAWQSYTAYENAYMKSLLVYEKDVPKSGLDPYLEGFKKESAKFRHDVGQLIKKKNIDEALVTVLERRLANDTAMLPKYEAYFDNIKKLLANVVNATTPEEKKKNTNIYLEAETRWLEYYKGAFERAVIDIEEIAKSLTGRYGQQFSVNDFLVVQMFPQRMKTYDSLLIAYRNMNEQVDTDTSNKGRPPSPEYAKNIKAKDIVGKWNADGAVISISQNGKVTWVVNTEDKATGKWKLENDKLKMDVVIEKTKKKLIWSFNLAQIAKDSFTMETDGENKLTYYLVRIPD